MPKRSAEAVAARPSRARPTTTPGTAGLPRWAVPAAYALACLILFHEFILGPGLLLGTDTQALSYFARTFYTGFVRTFHAFPLWNPLVFGGLPFLDGMHGDIFYPPSLALFFMSPVQFWGWKMILHVFLAGIFTYLWLRELGLQRETAFFGGLVYLMGADLVSLVYPGGDGKLFVSALAPLAFLLTHRALTRKRVQDFALLSLGIALLVFTSHMQAAYFAIWGISLYAFFLIGRDWRADRRTGPALARLGAFILAGLLAVGAGAVQFFPPLGYLRDFSHRAERTNQAQSGEDAYRFSATYSLNPEEIVSLAVPEFVGDNIPHEDQRGHTYWGRNPFKINHEYAGFIPLLLLPLLFLKRRSAATWFFTVLAALALIYALGANTPLFRLFYLIPGVKLFRAPSLIIFLYGLNIATLGAFALDRLLAWSRGTAEEVRSARRYLWLATALAGVLAALAASGALTVLWQSIFFPNLQKTNELSANAPFILRGFALTFLLTLLVTAIWEGLARAVYGRGVALALICIVAFAELYRVDAPFIRATTLINDPNSGMFVANEATQYLQQRQREGEVFRAGDAVTLLGGGGGANDLAIHGIEQLSGHHGNEIGRYRNLVGGDAAANLAPSDLRLLDITNTVYLTSTQLIDDPRIEEVYRGTSSVVYRKRGALPRAYLVGRTEVVPDTGAVARLLSDSFPSRTTALLPEPLPASVQVQPDPQGGVQWLERGANAFRLRVQSDRPALLMVLDNYYPMWQATVDGQRVEVLRANYTFRAIPVAAGDHTVEFRYVPSNLRLPAIISALILGVLFLLGIGLPLLRRLRGRAAVPAT